MVNAFPDDSATPITQVTRASYQASAILAAAKGRDRNQAIQAMAVALEGATADILEANTLDLESSREMAVPELIVDWLKLTPERLQNAVQILKRLAQLSDPKLKAIDAPYHFDRSITYCQRMPLGTIALIYEAFPELGAIAAGFCLKTGNSLILRGGSEASHSNGVIYEVLQTALEDVGLPPACLTSIYPERGYSIQELVTQDQHLNLIIPYGRPTLVKQVIANATAPVLRSAMGNCYLYWSETGDLDLARWMIIDSHASDPDPVNAIEKVLVSRRQKPTLILRLLSSLEEQGFELRGDSDFVEEYPDRVQLASVTEWQTAYLKKVVAFRYAEDIEMAIAWINHYSSGHADCLVTESYAESRQFDQRLDSAIAYINTSPRFERNPKQGDSVFLGMSNQKGYRRGLVSLATLTTLKQVVQGDRRF
ncbi:MAG: glutamate-5-semialdehyde dehydrogenase [Jaaginema sp. PMC 1079.18]|nr:glutamate-5-semialdehyde dehydrogenase [Jaaginema sp. PMC 1080.18]MEC4850563.1 glutamate-5-semialdehyde dehydrogenase [Jaaginema sp. PMC 1079.18]MEC4866700.1 glutamate-5-semialdehyde dehydrogenase [Jaaginema sp. PMC 1078.18]